MRLDSTVLGCGEVSRLRLDFAVLWMWWVELIEDRFCGVEMRWGVPMGCGRAARRFAVALVLGEIIIFLFFACDSRQIACIVEYWDVL